MATGAIVSEDSFDYSGQIARCGGGGDTTVEYPEPTDAELELQELQLQLLQDQQKEWGLMQPWILSSMGLTVDEDGNYRKMTETELQENMSEMERGQYDLAMSAQDRLAKAYAGELDVSPALEQSLSKQESQLEEALSQRLGSDWAATTAGQQAMAGLKESHELVREETRRGEITGGTGITIAQSAQTANLAGAQGAAYTGFPGRTGGLFGATGQAMQPYQQQRMGQYNADMQTAMMASQQQAGLMSGLGSLIGSGMIGAGMYFSSKALKKNIKTITAALDKIAQIRGVTFDWKEDNSHDTGVIAEEIEGVVPGLVGEADKIKGVYYHKIIPILVEAIKEQQKQIDELRRK